MARSLKDMDTLALQRERARKLQQYAETERELGVVRAELDKLSGSAFTNTGPYIKAIARGRELSDTWRKLFRRVDAIERELHRRGAEFYPSDQPLKGFEGDPRQPLMTLSRYVASVSGRR